jgi:hypothetical protein
VRLAVQAGVGTSLVKAVRQEREQELGLPPSRERRGSDGKLYALQTRDGAQRSSASPEDTQAATVAVDTTNDDEELLIHQCGTEGCDAVTTEPSWHCGSCGRHWPQSMTEAAHCPTCDDCVDEHGAQPVHVLATLTSVEVTSGNTADGVRTTQAPYTPGTMKATDATLAYERLISALELIDSLRGMDVETIMAESPDPAGLRRYLDRSRQFLLALQAASLGVRAL